MSIQNTEFSGDVVVGRNLRAGGKMDVQGSATVHHNLIVKGWLDAVNIKGPNKGIFLNVSDLREAYPTPHDGWFAGVGASTPFDAYIGSGGDWVATGGTIEVTVDMTEYTEGVEALQEDIDAVAQTVNGHTSVINNHTQQLTQLGTSLNNVSTTANNAQSLAKLALAYPTVQFKGILESVDRISSEKAPVTIADIALGDKIYYVVASRCFVAEVDGTYYRRWNSDGELAYMDSGLSNILPNKLYVCRATGVPYWCDGNYSLKPIEVDLSSINTSIRNLQDAVGTAQAAAETAQSRADNAYSLAGAAGTYAKRAHSIPTAFFNTMMDTSELVVEDVECPTEIALGELRDAIVYSVNAYRFYCLYEGVLYTKWNEGAELAYQDVDGVIRNKLYADKEGVLYYALATNGKLLPAKIAFETIKDDVQTMIDDAANELDTTFRSLMAPRLFVNANKLFPSVATFSDVNNLLTQIETLPSAQQALYKVPGVVFTMKTADGWQSWQFVGSSVSGENPDWTNGTMWKKFGGSASVGNCYNVTVDEPLTNEFYTLERAIGVAWTKGYTNIGIQITFSITSTSWKTYQYIGANSAETTFKNVSNWLDLAGMSAGAETLININDLCGAPAEANYYSLASAIAALQSKATSSGITYAKSGLVITYQTGEYEWETKQFIGNVTDFATPALWNDYGGSGGGDVETTDTPEEDSTMPFNAGGAYTYLPASLSVNTEEEGVVKMKMVNAAGEDVGDEVQFAVGTGSGGDQSGTIVSLAYQQSPMYGNVGSSLIIRAAIRSITTIGSTEQDNSIATLSLYDRDTNLLLEVLNVNQASSGSMQDYTFAIDVSSYFAVAGVRRFRIVAEDDSGHTGSRNINVTAVDVSVSSVQTLQYTDSTSLRVGGVSRSIPFYKFANNASDRGITAITEIYLNGQWQELGRDVIQNTYSRNITIDPNNCLGEVLTHGVYPIRVHGVDVASGVVGNYLYSGIFVIDPSSSVPLVVTSWYSEGEEMSVKLYESVAVNFAVYDPTTTAPTAIVFLDSRMITTQTAHRTSAYTFTHQVTGVASDGTVTQTVRVYSGTSAGPEAEYRVQGSVIDAVIKSGAIYAFDFANRSNQETDHTIESNGYTITPVGCNWSTTGFVPMVSGGDMAFKVAEDMTATSNHTPYRQTSIESNGMAVQFAFSSKNLVDDNAVLMSCWNEGVGAGFYVTGKAVGIYCATGLSNHKEERFYKQGEKVTVAVVVEPAVEGLGQTRQGTTYYFIKLYLDGEEVAVIGYVAGQSNLLQSNPITWDGTQGDFYLYYMMAWEDYFQFDQAFQNYLVKLTKTADMVREYAFEDIMASQQVTELGITTTKLRPQAAALAEGGMAYIIECPFANGDIEALDTTVSTKTNMYVTLYYVDPKRPWTNFIAEDVRRRNQGTTSAQRPVKNPRYYLAQKNGSTYNKSTKTGGTTVRLLYTRQQIVEMGYDGALWDKAAALAAINKVQIHEDSIPVDIITVKVDYSDSSCANDSGVCDMMNATFRALGGQYLTPAQRAFDGTWKKGSVELSGLVMNHSTANFPVAMYRSKESTGASPYFHAKGNWKEDKKEQTALGFIDTPGYTKGCLNYGDFVEFYGNDGETLEQTKTRFLTTSGLDTESTYILTQYCGSSYKVMEYEEGAWVEQTGSMVQNANGRWTVTGKVMNPTDGFELLNYQGMDWFKGVSSVADMMAASTQYSKWVQALIDDGDISVSSVPAWTYYFESLVDDDDLAIAYALGKKVPYNLYRWMKFCDACDWDSYHDSDADGGAARLALWKSDMWKYANPQSVMAYDIFTDYEAAVDQRAKNMQPMWFLEDGCKVVNGVMYNAADEQYDTTTGMLPMRMYLNKVYDCDTCNGKDNDGGQTVDAEVDPNKLPDAATGYTNPYAGYNSVLFRNLYLQDTVNIDAGGTELSLKTVASAMRSCTATVDGMTLHPFSPEGAQYFFVTSRIKRWPKKVSSYDGERKYIDFTSTTANNIYFYALQGLGLTSLPAFIERRWRIRDGFYGTGDFFSGVLSGRVNSANDATITIRAAKTGYFGIGNDSSGSLSKSVYLEAGESYTFPADSFSHEEGALLYIYQADRMSMIDLSQISLSSNFDFSVMTLAEEIILGSEDKVNMTIGAYTPLTNVNLGELPFLELLDIRGTLITNVVASACPRLQTLKAMGSQLTRADIADGSKITRMELPATYQYLKLRYLPNMEMSGVILADAASVTTLIVEQCAKIDPVEMLRMIAGASGSQLSTVRAAGINCSYNGSDLANWSTRGWSGLDINLQVLEGIPAVEGVYLLTQYTDETLLSEWQSALPLLTIHQAQYTMMVQDDTTSERSNVTNLDNNTGYGTDTAYAPSGHISKILENRQPVLMSKTGNTLNCLRLSKSDYKKLADGTTFNINKYLNDGYDAFMLEAHYWRKGINDFKNQLKYTAWSSLDSEPLSTATTVRRALVSTLPVQEGIVLNVTGITEGESTLESSGVLQTRTGFNTYHFDVRGMKQVRWPGMNSQYFGACFLNEEGVIIGKFNMNINDNQFDFDENIGDYLFIDVPSGAVDFVFTTKNTNGNCEAISVDSSEVEAIEPDWVEVKPYFGAIYEISIDNSMQPRSMTSQTVRTGTGTATTWNGWKYNADGTLNTDLNNGGNVPTTSDTLNYTCKDFQNLAYMRGDGYQLFDYEMSKDVALMTFGKVGDRDGQRKFGTGKSSGGSTGYMDSIGAGDSNYSSGGGNKVLGYESFMACTYEWMDRVAVNVVSYKQALANHMESASGDPTDAVWHIYDPVADTERTVQGLTVSGQTVARTRHGRHCDIIASKFTGESNFASHYADGQYYTHSTCRVVGRAGSYASSFGGLAYTNANYASSLSYTYNGARLAFRPPVGTTIIFEDDENE